MKNLKLVSAESFTNSKLENAVKMCIDSDNNDVYFHGNQACSIYHFTNVDKKLSSLAIPSWDVELPLKTSNVVLMDYVLERGKLCLVYSSGDIVLYSPVTKTFEVTGSLESSILNAAWSPDQELLVLLTSVNTFIIMTSCFQPLLEKDLQPDEFGESKPITVGWGSKETQFHGSEGKTAAKVKTMEVKPAVPWDDRQPRISWRRDGELFVTFVIDSSSGCRQLRTWSREGNLQYTSEIRSGLEHPLCWRPSGNLITCTQQHPNKHEVVFFEKNGLPYDEFTLPFQPDSFLVKEVSWNCDSTILAVWGHRMTEESNRGFQVLLWSVNNYHWYLKQHLDFSNDDGLSILCLLWDTCHANELHILFNNGTYYQYRWGWTHHSSNGTTEADDVSVAVIDNDSILITPFRKMVVPPPMSAYSLKMPSKINGIAYGPGSITENFVSFLSDGRIALCVKDSTQTDSSPIAKDCLLKFNAAGGNGFLQNITPCSVAGIYNISCKSDAENQHAKIPLLSLSHWTWIANDELLCASSSHTDEMFTSKTSLYSMKLPNGNCQEAELTLRYCATINGPVISICSNEDGSVVAIQMNSGELFTYENGELQPWIYHEQSKACFPCPCPEFTVCTIKGKTVAFGLTKTFGLYCNGKFLVSNCTSYSVHDEYLLVSTCNSYLKCYRKESVIKYCYGSQAELPEVCSQQLERGANIVTSVPLDTKIILQMPRGNLEVINPRPLVLSLICKLLDSLEFKRAFTVAKRHRINLNILCDHNPKVFLENVELFIEQIKLPVNLNLFITSLQEEDVTQTMYSFSYLIGECSDVTSGSKVNFICDRIRSVLEKLDNDKYIQTVIATYAQKQKPEMDEALAKIKRLRDSPEVANEALKFLLYLVDVSELYKVALGTYDLEIAIMVAEQSNMDPKEYLPFLNSLQELEENFRKYKIDIHLQRYKRALENISKCADHFDECISLIKTQRLYTSALFLFDRSSDSFKVVWNEYGHYLMDKMYYNEAGLVFTKAKNYEKALQAFQESCDWQLALCTAHKLGFTPVKISVLCESIAAKLKGNQRYEEAAHLLEHYVQDFEESIVTLIEGHLWESALNLMTKCNRLDIVETHLKPALQDHNQHLCTLIDTSLTNFCRYFERLKVVRREKEKAALQHDGGFEYADDDLYSDTGSVSGISASSRGSKLLSGSLITRKSSRSRRKQELKKYRLKEGSANEDFALMTELSEIISKIDKVKDTLFSFLRALVQFDFIKEGRLLQQKMKQIQECIERDMPNIWISEKPVLQHMNFGPAWTANDIVEYLRKQSEGTELSSDREIPKPTWRKNMDIFLHCFD